jgi:hypothetical protein
MGKQEKKKGVGGDVPIVVRIQVLPAASSASLFKLAVGIFIF